MIVYFKVIIDGIRKYLNRIFCYVVVSVGATNNRS